jgi:hypothetical protein
VPRVPMGKSHSDARLYPIKRNRVGTSHLELVVRAARADGQIAFWCVAVPRKAKLRGCLPVGNVAGGARWRWGGTAFLAFYTQRVLVQSQVNQSQS